MKITIVINRCRCNSSSNSIVSQGLRRAGRHRLDSMIVQTITIIQMWTRIQNDPTRSQIEALKIGKNNGIDFVILQIINFI